MVQLYNQTPIAIFLTNNDNLIRVNFCNVKMKMKPCQFGGFHNYLINKSKSIKGAESSVELLLVKNNLVRKMELGDGRALYEHKINEEHHDHIICVETGKIIEFYNDELEKIQEDIVKK